MLTRLQVKNFRCLEDIDVPLSPLTAFVGPNGSGKTTILRAIDVVLGESWPSLRSFRVPQDFRQFDTNRDIEIITWFDPPYVYLDTLSNEHQIKALRLTCKPYKKSGKWGEVGDLHTDLDPIDEKNRVPNVAISHPQKGQRPQFSPLKVGTELRDYARVLFIDHRRSLGQHLPGVRGSVLGQLLQKARKTFNAAEEFKSRYEAAMETLRTDEVKNIEKTIAETTKRMLGFLGRSAIEEVDIAFGFADPANPFNSLRLEYQESNLTIPGEELGLGIQSAMVVGIFEAFRQLGGAFGTVVLEEPEMYLHPQAQRYFYRLLHEMTEKNQCQVIYTTHSPIFADVNHFDTLRLVRQIEGKTMITFVEDNRREALEKARKNFKIGNRFDPGRNEILFASRSLLVEGYGDRVATLMIADMLGMDLDAEGVTVVDYGGKEGIVLFAEVCKALQIPYVVIHDEDVWPTDRIPDPEKRKKQESENNIEQQRNQRIRNAVENDKAIYVITPSLETVLGISRDDSDKPKRIAETISECKKERILQILKPLVQALECLQQQERKVMM